MMGLRAADRTVSNQRRTILHARSVGVDMGAFSIDDSTTGISQYGANAGISAGAAIWTSPPGCYAIYRRTGEKRLTSALPDRLSQEQLDGYAEYIARVHYRLVSGVWWFPGIPFNHELDG